MSRSLWDELLTPLRGGGQAARALGAGSAIILRCGCRGIGRTHRSAVRYVRKGELKSRGLKSRRNAEHARDSLADMAERLGLGLLICAIACIVSVGGGMELRRLATPYVPVICSVAGLVWVVAAWILAPPAACTSQNGHEAEEQEQQASAARPLPQVDADEWLLTLIFECAAYAEEAGHKGVHLAIIADELKAESPAFDRWDAGTVRAHCERLGVPLRRSVRTPDGVTLGMHLDDLTAVLGMPPSQAVAAFHRTPAEAAGPEDTVPTDASRTDVRPDPSATPAVLGILTELLRRQPNPSPEAAA